MKKLALLIVLLLGSTTHVHATNVVINLNGFEAGYGLNITGPGYAGAPVYGHPGATYTALNVTTPGTYNVDFYHNSGALGSDYSFTFDGTNITSVTSSNHGTGPYTIVSSFTPDTMVLNTGTVVYNASAVNIGQYFGGGHAYLQPATPLPRVYQAIPGTAPIDNTRNTGAGNEDFNYVVDGAFNVNVAPGTGGGPTGIPTGEYYTTSGNELTIRSESVHYVVTSNLVLNLINDIPIANDTGWVFNGSAYDREFDMQMPIGGTGFNGEGFNGFTVVDSNLALPDGSSLDGMSGAGDFLFRPTLRYDGTSNGSGFYWLGPGPGIENEVFADVTGFDHFGNPVTFSVTAILPEYIAPPLPAPEPATLAMLGLGLAAVAVGRRRRC